MRGPAWLAAGGTAIAWMAILAVVFSAHADGESVRDPSGQDRPFPWTQWDARPITVAGVVHRPFAFDGHVHTSYSNDSRSSPERVLRIAEKVRLDGLVITDHGSSRVLRDVQRYRGPLKILVGEELGGEYGHVVAWNMHDRRGMTAAHWTIARLAPLVRAQGGAVILAHPGWFIENRREPPTAWLTPSALAPGGRGEMIDAIEIWNGMYPGQTRNLVERWVELMERGTWRPIVASSDFHNGWIYDMGTPRTVSWCPDGAPPETCMLDAARRGRAYLTDGPSLHLVVNDALPGSTIEVSPGGRMRVEVWAHAPDGGTFRLYVGRQIVEQLRLPPGRAVSARWDVSAPAQDGFVRADVLRSKRVGKRAPFAALTNAVRVRTLRVASATVPSGKPDGPSAAGAEPAPPRRVLMIGSSSVNGPVGHVLERELRARGIVLEREHRSSSGFARPDFHDWRARLRARGSLAAYAGLLVYLGGNDTQQIWLRPEERTPPGARNPDRWIRWPDPRWPEAYRARVRELVDAACEAGVPRVVVLPPADHAPRTEGERLRRVQQLQLEAVGSTRCGVGVDTRATERPRRAAQMTSDGVHLTHAGAAALWTRIERSLLAALL